jgi:hypothetical protein
MIIGLVPMVGGEIDIHGRTPISCIEGIMMDFHSNSKNGKLTFHLS